VARLSDFFEGMPLYDNPLQAIVEAIDSLAEKTARIIWVRNPEGEGATRKDTADGDNVVILSVMKGLGNVEITSSTEDLQRTIDFPFDFSRPPVVVAQAQAGKPVMVSVSNISEKSFVANMRSVGALDGKFSVNAINYIAIGVKNRSS
jgi:hypothetical protein